MALQSCRALRCLTVGSSNRAAVPQSARFARGYVGAREVLKEDFRVMYKPGAQRKLRLTSRIGLLPWPGMEGSQERAASPRNPRQWQWSLRKVASQFSKNWLP